MTGRTPWSELKKPEKRPEMTKADWIFLTIGLSVYVAALLLAVVLSR